MATLSAAIVYDPSTNGWSVSTQPIKINPGTSTITWSIGLAPGATGTIAFDTSNNHPGIEFAPGWPGTTPTGNATNWSTDVTDAIPPGGQSASYHYGVNALYNGQRKHWDPEVEMDPPRIVF